MKKLEISNLSKKSKAEIQKTMEHHNISGLEELEKTVNNFVAVPADHEFQLLIDTAILYTLPMLFEEIYEKIPKNSERYFSTSSGITYMGYGKDWKRVFKSTEQQKQVFFKHLLKIYKKDKNEKLANLILQVMGYESFMYNSDSKDFLEITLKEEEIDLDE